MPLPHEEDELSASKVLPDPSEVTGFANDAAELVVCARRPNQPTPCPTSIQPLE